MSNTSMKNFLVGLMLCGAFAASQNSPTTLPVATQTLLNGVTNPASKGAVKSVLKISCPKVGRKGTGFVISGGEVITTNQHVVDGCTFDELEGASSISDKPVKFTNMIVDTNRDLAILCVSDRLPSSLELNGDDNPSVETEVETWGYPLKYEGPAPILSRGYVAGYTTAQRPGDDPVKHLIVNGALNPGNSGGPLIDRNTGKVIGVVVAKWGLFLPNVERLVEALKNPGAQMGGGSPIYIQYDNGEVKSVTQQEGTRVALDELYKWGQVMIGEAISVSELNAFIKDKKEQLGCSSHRHNHP